MVSADLRVLGPCGAFLSAGISVGLLSALCLRRRGKEVAGISTAKCYSRIVLSKVSSCFLLVVAEKTGASSHLNEVEVSGQESTGEKFVES